MADGIVVDASELDQLAAHFTSMPARAGRYVRGALEYTSRGIRDDWRENLAGSASVPRGQYSVTYDVDSNWVFGNTVLRAEIGPELGRAQGAIVGLLEEGTPTTGPRGFGLAALQRNEPDFERGLGRAIDDAWNATLADRSIGAAASAVIRGRF